MDTRSRIKREILEALQHAEAEDGLYFENLIAVHEEEERPVVVGEQLEILEALDELIHSGDVEADDSGEKPVFTIARRKAGGA